MIPVCDPRDGLFMGIMNCDILTHYLQKGVVYLYFQVGRDLDAQVVPFAVGYWRDRNGATLRVLMAPAGWTLDQLRTVRYFR